ncbi:MAG: hypothetical protein JWL59_2479 [Chthoniobacteraceae bacterium]|nr:hypothetical protein [Chthoniobacteraceae bacterium]
MGKSKIASEIDPAAASALTGADNTQKITASNQKGRDQRKAINKREWSIRDSKLSRGKERGEVKGF